MTISAAVAPTFSRRALVAAALSCVGCLPLSRSHTAHPVNGAQLSAGLSVNPDPHAQSVQGHYGVGPVDAQFRLGVSRRVDIGIRYSSPLGLSADVNWMISKWRTGGVSLAPTVGTMYDSYTREEAGEEIEEYDVTGSWAHLPLLVDVYYSKAATITLTGQAGLYFGYPLGKFSDRDDPPDYTLKGLYGTGILFKVHVGDDVYLMPEAQYFWSTSDDRPSISLTFSMAKGFPSKAPAVGSGATRR